MLEHYLSSDPLQRRKAQQWLMQADTVVVLNTLLRKIEESTDSELRGLAWVLIKGKLQKSDSSKYVNFLKDEFSSQCLNLLKVESVDSTRLRLISTISIIANILIKHGKEWKNLWEFIRSSTSTASEHEQRKIALKLIYSLAEYTTLLELFDSDALALSQILRDSLTQNESPKEREAALDAILFIAERVASYSKGLTKLHKIKSDQAIKPFFRDFRDLRAQIKSLVPDILSVLKFLKEEICEEGNFLSYHQLGESLEHLAELSSIDPKFICTNQSVTSEILQFGNDIGTNPQLDLGLRKPALQLTVRLMTDYENDFQEERAESSSTIARNKINQFFINLIETSLQERQTFEETDMEWCLDSDKENDVSDHDTSFAITLSCLDEFLSTSKTKRIECLVSKLVDLTLQFIIEMNEKTETIKIVSALEILLLLTSKPILIPILPINQIIVLLIKLLQNYKTHCRVKWWSLCVLCEILNSNNNSELEEEEEERCMFELNCDWHALFNTLSSIDISHEDKIVFRLKHRLLKALALLFLSIKKGVPASTNFVLDRTLLTNVFFQIVIPAFNSEDTESKTLSYALLASIALAAEAEFIPFYCETMLFVHQTLSSIRPTLQQSNETFELLEAAIDVGKATCKAVGWNHCQNDLIILCDKTLGFLEYFVENTMSNNEVWMTVGVLMDALATFASVSEENYAQFFPKTLQIILAILKQEENTSNKNLTLDHLAKYLTGQVTYSENIKDGTLQFSTKNDDEVFFELKPDVVDERSRALVTFCEILPHVKHSWLSFSKETCEAVVKQLLSPFKMIRDPANDVAVALVNVLLPNDDNKYDCSISQGFVSINTIFELVQLFSSTMLIFTSNPFTLNHAAEALPHVESLLKDLFEANKISGSLLNNNSPLLEATNTVSVETITDDNSIADNTSVISLFLGHVFVAFEKIMVVCISNEFSAYAMSQNEMTYPTQYQDNTLINNELDSWDSDEDNEEDYDLSDIIYTSIMRSTSYLFQTFGATCMPLFDTNLKKSFSALLTAPEISVSGRVSSLYMFASAIEFGKGQLAETVLPVALLYARCNDKSCSIDIQEEDVERVQAAAYCIGVISQVSPEHFLLHIDVALKTLLQVLDHPHAKQETRLPAGECAYGSLLKIVLNPNYKAELEKRDFDLQVFITLSQQWLPPQSDIDECRTLTSILINNVLAAPDKQHPWVMLPSFRKEISRFLEIVYEKAKSDPTYIDKETRCSEKFAQALELLRVSVS